MLRALSLAAAVVLARPGLAAPVGVTVPLPTESCPDAGGRDGRVYIPSASGVLVLIPVRY